PLTVRVNGSPPASAMAGVREVMAGAGLRTVTEAAAAPPRSAAGSVAVIVTWPPLFRAVAVKPAVRWVAEIVTAAGPATVPGGGDAPDAVAEVFREPEVAVRPGRNAVRPAVRADAGGELGDDALGRDPPDAFAILREPEVTVRPRRDADGPAVRTDACTELGD